MSYHYYCYNTTTAYQNLNLSHTIRRCYITEANHVSISGLKTTPEAGPTSLITFLIECRISPTVPLNVPVQLCHKMDQPSQSQTSLLSPNRSSSYNRSCIQCNRRKVRCDRNDPCGRCVKCGEPCVFPGPNRAPRKLRRPPISEVVARLRQLEEVERLRSGSPASDHGLPSSVSSCSDVFRTDNHEGKLIVKEGKSRYVGDEASAVLGDKVCLTF